MVDRTPIESGLELRRGDFATLTDALDYAARGATGLNFYGSTGVLEAVMPYSVLREEAIDLALKLVDFAPKGALIGLIAETSVDFARAFYACQYAGLVPVPVPMPAAMGGRVTTQNQWQFVVSGNFKDLESNPWANSDLDLSCEKTA